MRRATVLNLHRIRFADVFAGNKILILIIFFFLIGVLAPAVFGGSNQALLGFGKAIYEIYRKQHFDLEFFSVFSNSLIFNLLVVCACFTVGTSMLGVILAPLMSLLYGGLFGSLASYLCVTYQLKGIAFNAVVLIPGYIISTVAMLFAVKEAVLFSYSVSMLTFIGGSHNDLPFKFKGYCLKFVIMIFSAIISALIDAAFSGALIKIFEF